MAYTPEESMEVTRLQNRLAEIREKANQREKYTEESLYLALNSLSSGTCVLFKARFYSTGRFYDYAAVKVNDKFYLTCSTTGTRSPMSSTNLARWLFSHGCELVKLVKEIDVLWAR